MYKKGNASRLDLIFRQNVMTAHAAGRWQRQQEAKKERPYLRYSAIMDGRTRPAHRALDGMVFPADDPFWKTFYPPNGFPLPAAWSFPFPGGKSLRRRCGMVKEP